MRYWWVNQKQTYKHEFEGGYMWSPKFKSNGQPSEFYDNMTRVQPSDVVFSFRKGEIVSVGIVQSEAYASIKPGEFGNAGKNWSDEGWLVELEYHELKNKIKPKLHIEEIGPLLPQKYSPLKPDGNGNFAYLFAVGEKMAACLVDLIGDEAKNIINGLSAHYITHYSENEAEKNIIEDLNLPHTEKNQLIKSRRGQGVFRSRLEVIEPVCRVTGISNKSHLIASHIKPWSVCDNQERLDGDNGLLLSPHIDHLFDKGYISFQDNGDLILCKCLSEEVLLGWSIGTENVGAFNAKQKRYLGYHREHVLKSCAK